MEQEINLFKRLDDKIKSGKDVMGKLQTVDQVNGVDKLARKFGQEIKFLEKVRSKKMVKMEHLQSTNLYHLNAIAECILNSKDLVSVLKPFNHEGSRLEVDVVCHGGSRWVKAIARNAKALSLISRGDGEYGQKSMILRAKSFLECAKNHQHMYRPPTIVFYFAYGIESPLAKELENLGIVVEGEKLPTFSSESFALTWSESEDASDENSSLCELHTNGEVEKSRNIEGNISNSNLDALEIETLNLDVSTLLVYVSNMSNGHADYEYVEPLLTQQAKWERERPIKPILDKLFVGKNLITCKTAYDNFTNIINLKELLKRVKVVEDIAAGKIMDLNIGGKIKSRSKIIFATGENLRCITVSANEGFVRAAQMQRVECTVFLHETRALSEMKEQRAKNMKL